jgi:hypothetical protein
VLQAHEILRQRVPYRAPDGLWGPEIEQVREMLLSGAFNQL